jgi:predicted CXXCH cytochrome family protein
MLLACGGVVALALGLISCSTLSRTVLAPLEIPGAHYVGNNACADCHAEIARFFPATPHAQLQFANAVVRGGAGCEACHGPGSRHALMPSRENIINPGRNPDACFQCHLATRAEFHLPHHHPVVEGRMNCVQCHDPHQADILKPAGGLAMAQLNQSCAECHRDQTRPFVFEHEALREGCAVCHNPHGSVNRKLLTESDSNLCLKCHVQVQGPGVGGGEIYIGNTSHTLFLRVGTCWTAGCHTAVHGSNIDPRMRF